MKQKLLNITFCFFLILCVNACTRDATSKIEQGASATQFHTNIITAEPEPAEPEIIDTPTPEPPQEPNGERTETVIETGFISRGETYSVTAYHDSEADKTMYRVYIIEKNGTIRFVRRVSQAPSVSRYDNGLLKISVSSENAYSFFYNGFNKFSRDCGFSRNYDKLLLVQGEAIVYLNHNWDDIFPKWSMVVCDIFNPEHFHESYFLDIGQRNDPGNAISSIVLSGDKLDVTYNNEKGIRKSARFLLSANLKDWQKEYYRWFAENNPSESGNFWLCDINFDGIPELFEDFWSSGGDFSNGILSFKNGKAIPFRFADVSRLYLLENKKTKEKVWLSALDLNSGWSLHFDTWTLYDFKDIENPKTNQLLSITYEYTSDDKTSVRVSLDNDAQTIEKSEGENGETSISIHSFLKELRTGIWTKLSRQYDFPISYHASGQVHLIYAEDDFDSIRLMSFLNSY